MKFVFSDFNHCPTGRAAIQDIIWILGHQMRALGHEVRWPTSADPWPVSGAEFADPPWINVLLETFADEGTIPVIAAARARGCRFLYIATELPTERGFNGEFEPGMVRRQEAFPEAARFCDGILHLVPGADVTEWYGRYAPAAYAELGWAPGLAVSDRLEIEPSVDFGFFGQLTWRRREILGELRRMGSVLVEGSLSLPRAERDAHMRACRVIVQIYRNPGWDYPSSTRCVTSLCLGRPVIAEPHGRSAPWSEVVPFATSRENFLKQACDVASLWRVEHAVQMDNLRRVLPPERCLEPALRAVGMM